jgi:diketogulonate reductase-like aldo/keto reductase
MRSVTFPDGRTVPALGQGTWPMGESRAGRAAEAAALRLGLDLGMTLIDTAEMYADGAAEEVVADAIAGRRDDAFVVSKALPQNAGGRRLAAACERSLRRLRIDRIDLYLLHWRGSIPLADTVAGMTALREAGKIAAWGVSNLDADDMTELAALPGGESCATDQVLYNPTARGIEFDLLAWCAARGMPVMAYSPVGQGGKLLRAPALVEVARRHGATPAQVAVAWSLVRHGVISIPKSSDPWHVRENAAAAALELTAADRTVIDHAFPPPAQPQPLAIL